MGWFCCTTKSSVLPSPHQAPLVQGPGLFQAGVRPLQPMAPRSGKRARAGQAEAYLSSEMIEPLLEQSCSFPFLQLLSQTGGVCVCSCRCAQDLLACIRSLRSERTPVRPCPSQGVDLYLMNWCSVQRIARRSRALSEQRVQALDDLGFDWSGADPLS